jgi:hypothetical protein
MNRMQSQLLSYRQSGHERDRPVLNSQWAILRICEAAPFRVEQCVLRPKHILPLRPDPLPLP